MDYSTGRTENEETMGRVGHFWSFFWKESNNRIREEVGVLGGNAVWDRYSKFQTIRNFAKIRRPGSGSGSRMDGYNFGTEKHFKTIRQTMQFGGVNNLSQMIIAFPQQLLFGRRPSKQPANNTILRPSK